MARSGHALAPTLKDLLAFKRWPGAHAAHRLVRITELTGIDLGRVGDHRLAWLAHLHAPDPPARRSTGATASEDPSSL